MSLYFSTRQYGQRVCPIGTKDVLPLVYELQFFKYEFVADKIEQTCQAVFSAAELLDFFNPSVCFKIISHKYKRRSNARLRTTIFFVGVYHRQIRKNLPSRSFRGESFGIIFLYPFLFSTSIRFRYEIHPSPHLRTRIIFI